MSRGDFEPVAIVGRSCVLPGATSPAALWEAVSTGRDLLSSAPADRWRLPPELALTDDPARSADRSWSDRGGYVSGFDALLAAAPLPEEVHGLDWVFQWSVWAGREALRDAGHDGRSDRVGAVFGNLGFPSSQMSRFAEAVWFDRARPDPRDRHMSGLPALLLARVLGLGLGAYTLDAACASSLYALHLACAELHDRRADLMLAGAVCRSDDLFIHVGFCALQALSRTGRSRPFHAEADGLVPAEGAAFVALKRLADAEAAGDRVLGVIRGIGLSNDGRGRGLLAPSSAGQQRALHQAWDHSGLDPAALGLVECHATGTTVGDATEVETLQAVLGAHHAPGALPVGSFKSNCGHLITAAGAAGLLKVLGALEHHQRPPTLHAQQAPHPALARSALRLVHELEGWPSDRPRVGAVSAFGFGGNNAHLIVTEHEPSPRRAPRAARAPIDLAVVGLGARVADGRDIRELSQHLLEPGTRVRGGEARSGPIALPLRGNRFPPTDLSEALPQQLALLAVAREAVERLEPLPRDRTSIHIGAQSDPEVARYGARWRLRSWLHGHPADVLDRACDGVVAELSSAGVVGNMPNIPANRLNSQLDVGGPGFTVAAEELSGLRALEIASRALRVGETDAAVVGAVDLCCEPVHAAASALLPEAHRTPGDAAVVLVLKRHADAVRDGDPVYAVFPEAPTAEAHAALGTGGIDLAERFGHAHAASGLVHVVAAVLACRAGRIPGTGAEGARPGPAELQLDVVVEDMLGTRAQVRVAAAASPADLPAAPPDGPALQFAAHPPPIRLPSPEALAAGAQLMAPAPALPSAGDTPPRAGATGFDDNPPRPFPAPPVAAQAPVLSAPVPTTRPAPVPAPPPTRPTLQGPVTVRPPPPAAARLAAWHSQLSALHQTYLNQQAELHARFLRTRAVASDTLLAAIAARGRVVPQAPTPPIAAPPPRRPAAPVAAPPPPVPDPVPRPAPAAAPTLPGPKFSRSELESLASDRISVVLGPLFARQDPFPRQVRMPEPPLLLADRVTGIDAEPGSMKLGTIWTETDVTWGAWYLHQGHMPAGVMIEAGQADLLLISYLGADFHNRGERVYRLLGCELTYSGGLPAPGDTLAYEIHVDGHASQGDTRLFFFHYDCRVAGDVRLSVRQGQAGFFSDLELAESGGVLWDADTGEHIAGARVDPPVVRCTRSGFTRAQLEAFADGDGFACFGPGFERLQTHVARPG